MILVIEFSLGITYLLTGLSCLLHPQAWLTWMDKIRDAGPQAAIVMGMISLMLCAFIVAAHPVFSGPPLLITIIGLIGMAEGALYLLYPASLSWIIGLMTQHTAWFRPLSVFATILGAVILYIWYHQAGF